jgi:2-keto-4-pentenoate hydratase
MSESTRRAAEEAARLLVEAERTRVWIDRLPPDVAPESVAEAYAVQDAVSALRGPALGWKTSAGAPPTCSPVFTIVPPGAALRASDFHEPKVEVEFGFVALEDLPPAGGGATAEDIFPRLAFVPVIEVVSSRYLDRTRRTKPEVLADGSNGVLAVGAPRPWSGVDFAARKVELAVNGAVVQTAVGTHPLAQPADLAVWLAGHLAERAEGLKTGVVVTTGGLRGAWPVRAGGRVQGDWGDLGRIDLRFE